MRRIISGEVAMRAVALAAFIGVGSHGLALADEATGIWAMDNGKVTVRVSSCGDALCGRIVALQKPLDKQGNPKLDKDNPNPALRKRPMVGLTLFRDLKPAGDNRWEGQIYVPDDGKTYDAVIDVSGDVMKVKGCVVVFCKSRKFVRVD
jgi:uncharacterized protein (DUF2147 family)